MLTHDRVFIAHEFKRANWSVGEGLICKLTQQDSQDLRRQARSSLRELQNVEDRSVVIM